MRAIRSVPGLANNLSARPYIRGAFLEDVWSVSMASRWSIRFTSKNFQNLISALIRPPSERIDVYTGGFPVKYGTRSAGVIDVTPRTVDSAMSTGWVSTC